MLRFYTLKFYIWLSWAQLEILLRHWVDLSWSNEQKIYNSQILDWESFAQLNFIADKFYIMYVIIECWSDLKVMNENGITLALLL